ncbi:MAG: hypothetical protein V1648_03500 [Candidatus Aenigmatarchaeota archaeon]
MEMRKALVLSFVIFSCYLILSLTPVSAYATGEFFTQVETKARLSIDPVLKIMDELKPVECESQGTLGFRAYVENVGEFDIKSIEALVEDTNSGTYYNVTNAVSCGPRANLISNQEIACTVNIKTLLAKLPACPLESTGNRLYLSFEIVQEQSSSKVTDSKAISIIGTGIEPGMAVDFAVSRPPYPVPVINCNVGSEIDVPVVISHAEKLFGSIEWSFSANGASSKMIECSKLTSTEDDEGRKDIYICMLTISSVMYPKCEEGAETTVGIFARAGDFNLTGSFATTLTAQDLNLGLKISELPPIDCQIIGQDGRCVPADPQKNVTVTITGNVPERLKVFESRYKLGNGNVSTLICKKLSSTRYQCMTFITLDDLPVPTTLENVTTKERAMTVYFDVKYLNYYTSISATKKFEMRGTALVELINIIELLNRDKDFFEAVKKVSDILTTIMYFLNLIRTCCILKKVLDDLESGGSVKKAAMDFAVKFFIGNAKNGFQAAFNALTKFGPGIISCIAEKSIEKIDKEIEELEDFEGGSINAPLEMPSFGENMLEYFPECTLSSFWDQVKDSAVGWLCALFFNVVAPQLGRTICNFISNPVVSKLMAFLDMLVIIISILMMLMTLNQAQKDLALSRETINLQLAASDSLTDYMDKMQSSVQMIASLVASSSALANITAPSYGTTKLLFISDRAGVLGNGDAICTQDMVTIDYDMEKLNQTENFKPELYISSSSHSKTLHFDELKGTVGPYSTDALLGTDPNTDPSEMYTFRLTYAGRSLDYQLNYVNQPCGSE